MSDLPKRTKKDEDDYNKHLRREEPIKTEVIVELRDQNKSLWQSQANLLQALIEAQDALRVYRMQALEIARKRASQSDGHCVPGCRKHEWDSENGWYRVGEREK